MSSTRPLMTRPRATGLAAVVVLALGGLTACGGDDGASGSGGEGFNDADVAFAQDMVPHHAQAVQMAQMVDGQDVSPEVAALAADIEAAQAPEIETMTGWLEEWGEEVPDTSMMGMDHSGMEGMEGMEGMDMDMPGMMSSEEMAELDAATGAAFETMWLEMMIEHHEGAIEMAQAEQEDGEYAPAIALAEEIEAAQTEEIAVMEELLAR